MALTLSETKNLLLKCTKEEVLEIMDFPDVEQMVLSLEDKIEDDLEGISERLYENGLT